MCDYAHHLFSCFKSHNKNYDHSLVTHTEQLPESFLYLYL